MQYYDRKVVVPSNNTYLGDIGEQSACAQLQAVFTGHASRLQGTADQGLDLAFTGRLPCPEKPLLHFVAQVKTGSSHVFKLPGSAVLKVKRLPAKKVLEWKQLDVPVLFLWVNNETWKIHWALVNKDNSSGSIFLSNNYFVCPATPYDLLIRLNKSRKPSMPTVNGNELHPPSKVTLKQHARDYYCGTLLKNMVPTPVLGEVSFTWAGWRHMVRSSRTHSETQRSLSLLPLAGDVLRDPTGIVGFRRLSRNVRGKLTTESRLIAFERQQVSIGGRAAANLVVVVKERLVYPSNWRRNLEYHKEMIRDLIFYSIYEEAPYAWKKRIRRVPSGAHQKGRTIREAR